MPIALNNFALYEQIEFQSFNLHILQSHGDSQNLDGVSGQLNQIHTVTMHIILQILLQPDKCIYMVLVLKPTAPRMFLYSDQPHQFSNRICLFPFTCFCIHIRQKYMIP